MANEYASFIAIFHFSVYSAFVKLFLSCESPNVRSTGRRCLPEQYVVGRESGSIIFRAVFSMNNLVL